MYGLDRALRTCRNPGRRARFVAGQAPEPEPGIVRTMTKQAEVLKLPVADPRKTPEAERLEATLAKIAADAREQARRYQEETYVPEGGE